MVSLDDFENETWEEEHDGVVLVYDQVVGNSGVYLIITNKKTGEIVRDDRPWQMRMSVS